MELLSDCPTAVNSDPSQLAGLQHLFIRSFFAEYEVEEAHKEALAIAEERWARIFNHNRPVAGRAHDPPDHKMVWGKPEDMAKHPDGEEHIRLWDLPRLWAMVTRVKAKLEASASCRTEISQQRHFLWMASPSPCSGHCRWTSLMMRFARSSSRCLPVCSLGLGSSTACR